MIIPTLIVRDVTEAVDFLTKVLDFTCASMWPEDQPFDGVLTRGADELHVALNSSTSAKGASSAIVVCDTVEGGAEFGEGAEADALDLAGAEQGQLGLAEADLGGEVAGLEALLHDQLVEGDADRHQIISSSSAWTLPACSMTRPSRNRAPPIMPRVMPATSK